MSGRAVLLVVNPAAGGGRAAKVAPKVEAALRADGCQLRTEFTRELADADVLAASALDRGETVVSLGGDGLVGRLAGALAGTDGVLGVLPGGRGNDFLRSLGLPRDPVAACAAITHGVVRRVDVGDVDGRPFATIATVGFDSVANQLANDAHYIRGQAVYLYAALRALASWTPATFSIDCDGEVSTVTGWTVLAGNANYYGGGMKVAPGARLDDGALEVVTIGAISKRGFVRALPKVFSGQHVKVPAVTVRSVSTLRIEADRAFTMYADGDPIGDLPVTVTVRPAALQVLALPTPEPKR